MTEADNTSEQLQALVQTLTQVECLTRKPERGETGDQPTVMIPNQMSAEAATAVILCCTNRINDIVRDDTRWQPLPSSQRLTREEKKMQIEREKLEIEKERIALQERALQLDINRKVSAIKISQERRKMETTKS